MRRAALLAALAAVPAWAGLGYSRFSHPRGEYAFEYPSDWKRTPGLESVGLRPPGLRGESVRLSVERLPLAQDEPQNAEEYVKRLLRLERGLKKLEGRSSVKVAGIAAERVLLSDAKTLFGAHGEELPAQREACVVVPAGRGYYVIRLTGSDPEFAKTLPEYDRLVAGFKLRAEAR